MFKNTDRISIQVGLSGYSFKLDTAEARRSSGWMSAERIFTTPEFQKRYDEVEISVFTHKCALVPSQFFSETSAAAMLAEVCTLNEGDPVEWVSVEESLQMALTGKIKDGKTLVALLWYSAVRANKVN